VNIFKKIIISLVLPLSLISNAQASQYETKRFTAGPVIVHRSYSEDLLKPKKSDEYGILYGLTMNVEELRPKSYYYGFEGSFLRGNVTYDGSQSNSITNVTTPFKGTTTSHIFNIEGRLGYNYVLDNKTFLTPFVGLGHHCWFRGEIHERKNDYSEEYNWHYLAFGAKFRKEISDKLCIEFNAKLMQMVDGEMTASLLPHNVFELGNKLNFELEAPINYAPDCLANDSFFSSIQITPYYQNLNIGKSADVVVIRSPFLITYVEPSSKTHVYGTKIELVRKF
jgi:hypothetical protein